MNCCIWKKDEILLFLESNYSYISSANNEIILICEKYNLIDALIFLSQKSLEEIKFLLVLRNLLEKHLYYLLENDLKENEFKSKLKDILKILKHIMCIFELKKKKNFLNNQLKNKCSKVDDNDYDFWFDLLDFLYSFIPKITIFASTLVQ